MTGTNVATLPTNGNTPASNPPKRKLLLQLAERYGVEPEIFERTVASVAMPNPHTREELISCLIVANEHDLNPLTKEIHFMRSKTGQIVPIVGVDGWVKKLNTHPQFNGFEFAYQWSGGGKSLVSVTCTVHRKDREHPTVVTEFLAECQRLPGQGKGPNAWSMTPSRMLRHRALMQATRYAIGFGGVLDMDEFERWQSELKDVTPAATLAVPDDIPAEAATQQPVSEAEDTQDPPIVDPDKYIASLEESLATADDKEMFDEVWAAHLDGSDGRLSREHAEAATALHEKHGQRFEAKEPKGKKK
jgi:phage recombination protein Bet